MPITPAAPPHLQLPASPPGRLGTTARLGVARDSPVAPFRRLAGPSPRRVATAARSAATSVVHPSEEGVDAAALEAREALPAAEEAIEVAVGDKRTVEEEMARLSRI